MMADARYLGLLDMINGGGAGRAGDTFEGGPLSGLLNMLGIKPRGFFDRQEEEQQSMAPIPMIPMPAPVAPPPNPYAPGAITTTTLPPMTPVGQMSDEALIRLIRQAMEQAPSATGYGPR